MLAQADDDDDVCYLLNPHLAIRMYESSTCTYTYVQSYWQLENACDLSLICSDSSRIIEPNVVSSLIEF